MINIKEIYSTVQVQGFRAGGATIFVSIPEDRNDGMAMEPEHIINRVVDLLPTGYRRGHMTLRGGDPATRHQRGMSDLVDRAHAANIAVGIETVGTRFPKWTYDVDDITIIPNPPSSGNVTAYGRGSAIARFIENTEGLDVSLRIVIANTADWVYATLVHEAHPETRMYVAPPLLTVVDTHSLAQRTMNDPNMQDVFQAAHCDTQLYVL